METPEKTTRLLSKTLKTIATLSLVGLGISAYLTYLHFNMGEASEALIIHTSGYAKFLGIPVAIIGVMGYTLILGIPLVSKSRDTTLERISLLSLVGTIMSVRQMYGSLFVIESICPWCVTSAAIMTTIYIIARKMPTEKRNPAMTVLVTAITLGAILINGIAFGENSSAQNNVPQILTEGKYVGYSPTFEARGGCWCSTYHLLTLVNADETETYTFYDYDKNGDLGSSDNDEYAHYIGSDHEKYTNNMGVVTIIFDGTPRDPNNTISTAYRERSEVMAEANADYQELLRLIGKN